MTETIVINISVTDYIIIKCRAFIIQLLDDIHCPVILKVAFVPPGVYGKKSSSCQLDERIFCMDEMKYENEILYREAEPLV